MSQRLLFFLATLLLAIQLPDGARSQDLAPSRLADQIHDVADSYIFVQSAESTTEHFQDAIDDALAIDIDLDDWISTYPKKMTRQQPLVFYSDAGKLDYAVQLPFDSRDAMVALAKSPEKAESNVPFLLNTAIGTELPLFARMKKCYAIMKDGNLIASPTAQGKADEFNVANFDVFKEAKPLSASLDPRMIDFFDRVGIGAFARPDSLERINPLWFGSPKKLSVKEQELYTKIELGYKSLEGAAIGVTYKDRQINGEMHAKFARNDAFDELFDFEAIQSVEFEPTIGLPAENLLFSFSSQTSILKSPDVGRLLLKLTIPGMGFYSGVQQDSPFFHVTGKLLADSSKDVAGARVALYRPKDGAFSAIAILDAREPEQFFNELEKLMVIIEPQKEEGLSDAAIAEINRLINDLGSKKYSVRERAETRLSLSGGRALAALKMAAAESESAEARLRASRILKRLASSSFPRKKRMGNLNFWANYAPDIAIEKGESEFFGRSARVLRIQHPSTFTDEEARNATEKLKQLFGPNWDRVPVVRVEDRFVVMIGGDDKALQQTIANLSRGLSPIKKVAIENAPYFKEGNLQLHISFQRICDSFGVGKSKFFQLYVNEHPRKNVLTSVSLDLKPDYWQSSLNMPIEEFKHCLDFGDTFLKR